MKGFKSFLMQGELVVIAVGLVVALAFSTLIKAFSDNIITPVINSFAGGGASGKGLVDAERPAHRHGRLHLTIVLLRGLHGRGLLRHRRAYRRYMQRRGTTVFGAPAPSKTCPSCLSAGLPIAATKCKFCSSDVPVE